MIGCGDDDTSVADTGPRDDTGPEEDGGPADNGVAYDEVFSGTCVRAPSCAASELETACTCSLTPMEGDALAGNLVGCNQLEATGETMRNPKDDFCDADGGDGVPNLACNMPGSYRPAGTSQMVTMYGVVDVFGNGANADAITVEVYEEGPDGTLGALLGSAVASIEDPCSETEDEIERDVVVGTRELGFYVIPNIPSETPLIVKSTGDAGFWRDIYSYNIQALNDVDVETDAVPGDACETLRTNAAFGENPRWEYRARIISTADWESIPLTAGLVDGIRRTSGVVAGEAHDCDDVRIEFAHMATSPEPQLFTYFNDNPDNPLPDNGRNSVGTSLLGLYASLDVPEGPVDIAGVTRIGGEVVSLGWYRAQVFAGAVTSISLRGLRSQQVPSE